MNPQLTNFLRRSISESEHCSTWNEFRRLRPESNDLSNINLDKATIRGANFRKINFCGMRAEGAEFNGCDFTGSDFFDSIFRTCTFQDCVLTECDFSNTLFRYCVFKNCDIHRSNFKDVHMDWATFRHSSLTDSQMLDTRFTKCDLRENYLADAFISIANLRSSLLNPAYEVHNNHVNLPEVRDLVVNQGFSDMPMRDILRKLSVISGVTFAGGRDLDAEDRTYTINMQGLTMEKLIDVICRECNIELVDDGRGEGMYFLRQKTEKRVPIKKINSSLKSIGHFIEQKFGVDVEWSNEPLSQRTISVENDRISLRELIIDICCLAKCRVITLVQLPDGSMKHTEERGVDFKKVSSLHFYQVHAVSD